MTIKVYISGICGSHEVRKQQQRVLFILQSLPIDLQVIDVTEPGRGDELIFMQEEAKKHNKSTQLPPQIFNGDEYCGDYADFELANDDDVIMRFLKLQENTTGSKTGAAEDVIIQNGIENHGNEDKDADKIMEEKNSNESVDAKNNLAEEQIISNDESNLDQGDSELKNSIVEDSIISEKIEENETTIDAENEIKDKELSEDEESEEETDN